MRWTIPDRCQVDGRKVRECGRELVWMVGGREGGAVGEIAVAPEFQAAAQYRSTVPLLPGKQTVSSEPDSNFPSPLSLCRVTTSQLLYYSCNTSWPHNITAKFFNCK